VQKLGFIYKIIQGCTVNKAWKILNLYSRYTIKNPSAKYILL